MLSPLTRRRFLQAATLAGAGQLASQAAAPPQPTSSTPAGRPLAIASGNGLQATARAMALIQQGADALDAVLAGVNLVEDDPNDHTVGLGGYPNEAGVVELDASVMHGPTGRGGAVAALQNIRNPSNVARLVMERTDHVLLVGAGALQFAKAHGFTEENLLTNAAREAWLKWKESLSAQDDWLPPHSIQTPDVGARRAPFARPYGTINCNALDQRGGISGCTTTSGLAFKIPGRVGDSPILGAGLWVDNEVGAAGSTGRGEANLLACSSVMVVEYMRQGLAPEAACLRACQRIVTQTKMRRLLDDQGRPKFNVSFYAFNKQGDFGGAAIWPGFKFAVNTGEAESRLVAGAHLY
ncbi:MAG: N(4)-(beta-N-acetylglucosaminyl)-L-asparaginase [Verrucomicrobia bacterium]|nr:N(4)-(beta-N-acetylglucosaminyl)-L-asparaginase [Verrucomicrobiota bacterium]